MTLRKAGRVLLWGIGGLVVAAAGLYLLRWPLLGGVIRSKASALVSEQLGADLDLGDLSGSLLWSIRSRNATIRPRAGSPLRSASVARVDVSYGLLGSGEPTIRVEDARVVLAPKDGPAAPVQEVVRDVVSILRSVRFAGSVAAANVELVLPDGRSIRLENGSLDHAAWSVSVRTPGFGSIEGKALLQPDGSLTFDGRASEGPLRSARLELGGGTGQPALKISAEIEGHEAVWTGTASFEQGRISKLEGELSVKEGRAKTRVDLVTGLVDADLDAVTALAGDFRGDVAVRGALHGPLAGPAEAWTVRQARASTRDARYLGLTINEAEVLLGEGTLAKIPFKAAAKAGADEAKAEGIFGWNGKPDLEATVAVAAADVAPYLALIKDAPTLQCRDAQAAGRVVVREGAFSYDGTLRTGPGEIPGLNWKSLDFDGVVKGESLEARRVVVTGTPFADTVAASGKLEGETLSLKFTADEDRGEIGGRYQKATGDFQGRMKLEGPMAWLGHRFGFGLPAEITPILAEGKVTREKGDSLVLLEVAGKTGFAMSLQATVRQQDGDWIVALAPGGMTLPERKIQYDAFTFSLTREKASLENLKLSCTNPELAARLSGSATWDAKESKILFRMIETTVAGTPIDPLFARVTIDRASGDMGLNLRWGQDEGDHLRITGRRGKELDLKVELLAADLKKPLLRRFLPGVDLEGSIAVNARVRGTLEEPAAEGTIQLNKITTAGLPPLTLTLAVQSSKSGVTVSSPASRTPYGELRIDGVIPLTGGEAPVDLTLQIVTDDLTPLLDRMTRQARVWIPKGRLEVNAALRGPLLHTRLEGRVEFSSPRWQPPPPLPVAEDLRVVARLDADGVVIEMVDGLLGQGPFWASGRWDVFRPGRPLSLWITAWDALAVDDPLARLRVKPDVLLTWEEKASVKLSGHVEIPLAIWHREFSSTTPGAKSVFRPVTSPRLRLVPGEAGGFLIPGIEGLEGLDLDLTFVTTGEFRIENSVVGILLHAEGQLTGTGTDPALSGKFRAKEHRGEVKLARGNFLRIESGEVTLPEEIGRAPTVRFQGGVGAGEGAINVIVEGPLESPALVLRSDPPQSQKDLLAKLAFGLGTGSFSNETAAATLAVYVYAQTQDDWPSADRKESFLDRFRPTVVPGETSQQRRVPWQLPPSGNLRSTSLRTEYVYNSYFSVIAETSREGDVGGDLRLRIRF